MLLLAMPCSNLCVLCFYFHAIWLDPCLHILYAWILILPCLCVKFLHVYMHLSVPMSLDLCFHMLVCLDLCSLYDLCYHPRAYALHAMFVCLDIGYVCHAIC